MNGFLFPQRVEQLSLRMPMYGCTNVPVRGPANQVNASNALLNPNERRYGCHEERVNKGT